MGLIWLCIPEAVGCRKGIQLKLKGKMGPCGLLATTVSKRTGSRREGVSVSRDQYGGLRPAIWKKMGPGAPRISVLFVSLSIPFLSKSSHRYTERARSGTLKVPQRPQRPRRGLSLEKKRKIVWLRGLSMMPGWRKDRDTLKGRPRSQGSSGSFKSHENCRFPRERTVNYTSQRHVFLLAWLLRIQDDNALLFPGVEFSECFVCTHKHKLKMYTHAYVCAHTVHTQLHSKEHMLVLQYFKLSDAELPQATAPTPRERRSLKKIGERTNT